ncbi:metal ABC transporter solute-binding protein, Zn/Mn family [Bacillus cihuensis]|uniref:metal ABC transporter solute-binding protein, Zn/Mn family n=1 Tax=Bacillus cihuensis TaxID=1208599 RepID=UPI000406A311|nr:zinc ABC transporter substrate-binding protein [Bacillus cihuensis]
MKKKLSIAILFIFATFLAGCNSTTTKQDVQTDDSKEKLMVYTTVYALEDFTKKIGGDFVDVKTVYPPGTDEHSFEPSQKDIIGMAQSDLFFYIGHNLEGFVNKSKSILEDEGAKVVAVGEKIDLPHSEDKHDHGGEAASEEHDHDEEAATEEHQHEHGDVDPHIWIDPVYATQMAEIIKDELSEKMPAQADYFQKQYEALSAKLKNLDHQFDETISTAKTKKLIVSHAAYGYWEKRYDLEQISVSGISANEPSQKQLENIVKTAKDNGIQYIIYEQNISSKLTKIIQDEIGAKALKLHNLSVLTDNDINNKEDYFSIMNKNLETLKTALN